MLHQRDQAQVMAEYCAKHNGTPVPEGFSYNSGRNTEWLTVDQIRELIRSHVDASFKV